MPPVIGLLSPVMALEKLQPPGDGLKIQAELSAVFPFLEKFLSIILAAEMLFEVYEILQNGTN